MLVRIGENINILSKNSVMWARVSDISLFSKSIEVHSSSQGINLHTHTHTHTHMVIFVCEKLTNYLGHTQLQNRTKVGANPRARKGLDRLGRQKREKFEG